jgi:hypothetical protein
MECAQLRFGLDPNQPIRIFKMPIVGVAQFMYWTQDCRMDSRFQDGNLILGEEFM